VSVCALLGPVDTTCVTQVVHQFLLHQCRPCASPYGVLREQLCFSKECPACCHALFMPLDLNRMESLVDAVRPPILSQTLVLA
jgi:hypothetical protein